MAIKRLWALTVLLATASAQVHAQDDLDALLNPTEEEAAPRSDGADAAPAPPPEEAPPGEHPEVIPVAQPGGADAAADRATRPARASRSRLVEEIVVTAQKREENLQDVPIAVAAFSAEMLDAKGIDDVKGLAINTPGLVYNQIAGYSILYMRGIGSDAFIPSADASIATYIDGIYYPFNQGLAQSFGAVQRVEVLKGPQGTLFGRNSTGGAINVVTRKPDLQETSSEVQVSYADYDQLYTRAHVNVPLHDAFALSVSGLYNREDPYYDLISLQRGRAGPDVTRGFRAKLRWAPSDSLDLVYTYSLIEQQGHSGTRLVGRDVKPLALAIDPTAMEQPDYVDGSDYFVYFVGKTPVHVLDAKYSAPWFDVRFLGGDQDIKTDSSADYDGTNGNIASFRSPDQIADIRTYEVQFISNTDGWGADWLKWIGGYYYIESLAGYNKLLFGVEANALSRLPDALEAQLRQQLADLGISGIPGVDIGGGLVLRGLLGTESTSYFAQGTADITDWFAVTLGGRYQTETRRIVASSTSLQLPDTSAGPTLFNFPKPSEDTSNFSPKISLDFKPWDDTLIYLSYTKGFKSGTFNIINIYQANSPFIPPETVETYEAGYKGDLLGGYLRFNAAAFFNEITNVQVQTISLTSGGAVRFESAGGAENMGAEFDLTWEFLPRWVPGLVFVASGMYLKGEYTDYTNGTGFDETTGTFQQNLDFTGNETLRTPEYSGSVGLNYNFNIGPGNLELGADVYYNSGFYFTAQNKERVSEQAYELVNARISYLYEPWNVRLTAFGKNINNGKYHIQMFENDFSTWKTLAPPAYYGVRLNWSF
jgi:iron complex outermembrane recepter protein